MITINFQSEGNYSSPGFFVIQRFENGATFEVNKTRVNLSNEDLKSLTQLLVAAEGAKL